MSALPPITIAGQTELGGGIALKTHPGNSRSALAIARGCHDVVIRHVRSRSGPYIIQVPPLRPRAGRQISQ